MNRGGCVKEYRWDCPAPQSVAEARYDGCHTVRPDPRLGEVVVAQGIFAGLSDHGLVGDLKLVLGPCWLAWTGYLCSPMDQAPTPSA